MLRSFKINQNVITFFVCILISTVFWSLRVLNGRMTTTIDLQIKVIGLSSHVVTSPELQNLGLKVQISDPGFSILNYKYLKYLSPITIDLTGISDSTLLINYDTKDLMGDIKSKLLSTTRIDDIIPDNIQIRLSRIIEKNVPVKFIGNFHTAKQRVLRDYSLDPDSISISGIKSIIDSITYVETQYFDFENIDESYSKVLSLSSISNVQYSDKYTKLTMKIEPFTEETFLVPIKTINFPDSLSFKPMPSVVEVTFCAPLTLDVSPSEFVIEINYLDSAIAKGEAMHLVLSQQPQDIFNVSINPEQIDYFVESRW